MKYFRDDDGTVFPLNKCPFCGVEQAAEILSQEELWEMQFNASRYTVCCSKSNGGCGATCGFYESKYKAVSRWNTRVVI